MSNQNKKVKVTDLDHTAYQPAWDFQEKLLKEIVDLKIANRNKEVQQETPNYFFVGRTPSSHYFR